MNVQSRLSLKSRVNLKAGEAEKEIAQFRFLSVKGNLDWTFNIYISYHYVKCVRIWSFSGPYFPTFGLNTKRYTVSIFIQSACGKIRTRKTSNTDAFYVSYFS